MRVVTSKCHMIGPTAYLLRTDSQTPKIGTSDVLCQLMHGFLEQYFTSSTICVPFRALLTFAYARTALETLSTYQELKFERMIFDSQLAFQSMQAIANLPTSVLRPNNTSFLRSRPAPQMAPQDAERPESTLLARPPARLCFTRVVSGELTWSRVQCSCSRVYHDGKHLFN